MKFPTVIVLASGRGERYKASGGITHKLHAKLCGKTILQHTLDTVVASGLPWHLEQAGHPGMGDSISAGIAATPDSNGWLILPADLPLIRLETIQTVARLLLQSPIVVPTYKRARGHPVGFGRICKEDLLALSGPFGAVAVLRKHPSLEVALNDMGIRIDIDTVDDLKRAEHIYRQRYFEQPKPQGCVANEMMMTAVVKQGAPQTGEGNNPAI
jgi:molybdenum cofactor cytidylyltransferase